MCIRDSLLTASTTGFFDRLSIDATSASAAVRPTAVSYTHLLDLDGIVRDQPVAALDELNGRLALADTGIAQNQDALAVDLSLIHIRCV